MRCIPVQEAVGLTLCHDITEVIPGGRKGPAFRRGHVVRREDIDRLLSLGKEHLFVWEGEPENQVHEDDAARRIAWAIAGPGVDFGEPKEGRINFTAARQGLLDINLGLLERVNGISYVTLATAHSPQAVEKGRMLAGTRVIPLTVPEATVKAVEDCCSEASASLLTVLPFKEHRVGVVITGGEVHRGRIKDGFGPVLREKFASLGSSVHSQEIVPDETETVAAAIDRAISGGATLVAVTGGMSVDPDDKTPAAIRTVGCDVVAYGAPVYPAPCSCWAIKAMWP